MGRKWGGSHTFSMLVSCMCACVYTYVGMLTFPYYCLYYTILYCTIIWHLTELNKVNPSPFKQIALGPSRAPMCGQDVAPSYISHVHAYTRGHGNGIRNCMLDGGLRRADIE